MKKRHEKAFKMALATTLAASAVVAVTPGFADAASKFKDVPSTNVHANDISTLAERGIITGVGNGLFAPNAAVTRGQVAKIIAGALGLDTKNVKNPNFKDVKTTDWFYGPVAALKEAGVVSGKANGTYGPNDKLTRAELAKILVEAFGLQGTTNTAFNDVDNNAWYANYVKALLGNNVTKGTTATTFSPKAVVTRGQLASFVVRSETAKQTQTVSTTVTQLANGQVKTANGVFEVDPAVSKIFNASNAAALQNAGVELIVEYTTNKPVASTDQSLAVNTGKIIGVRFLQLNAANASFNAGGSLIPHLVLNAVGLAVSQVQANTLDVNKADVTIIASTIKEVVNVAENIIVALQEVVSPKVQLLTGAKLKVDTKTVITLLGLPANTTVQDIITNYNEIQNTIVNIIKDVITGGTTTPPAGGGGGGQTEAQAANSSIDAFITTLVTNTFNTGVYTKFGTLTDVTAPEYTFAFGTVNYPTTTSLYTIKNAVETTGSNIEQTVLGAVTSSNIVHLLNINEIDATGGGVTSTLVRFASKGTSESNLGTSLASQLSYSSVSQALAKFMEHDAAAGRTVSQFVNEPFTGDPTTTADDRSKFDKFDIVITFSDNSKLNYTVNLTAASSPQ